MIFSETFEEHLENFKDILKWLDEHGLKLNLQKVSLCQPKFKILGFTASAEGIEPNQSQVDAITNYPMPSSRNELLSFLGIVSWCRRFIYKCSTKTYFIREVANNKKFEMSKEAEEEFRVLKLIMA